MKVLVDTSIWIGFFSKGDHTHLEDLIREDLVIINDVILAELLPFLHHAKAYKAAAALQAIEKYPLDIHWPAIIELQKLNLRNGNNKVGIPDLIICQYTIQHRIPIWTNDKHFRLMHKHVNISLYGPTEL